jgi:hypothetical protein
VNCSICGEKATKVVVSGKMDTSKPGAVAETTTAYYCDEHMPRLVGNLQPDENGTVWIPTERV